MGILEPSQPSKTEIFSKFGFSRFPIHQTWFTFGHFEPILGQKSSKPLQKMPKSWWKKFENFFVFQKCSKLSKNIIWTAQHASKVPKSHFSKNYVIFSHFFSFFEPPKTSTFFILALFSSFFTFQTHINSKFCSKISKNIVKTLNILLKYPMICLGTYRDT